MLTSLRMREIKTPPFRSRYLGETFAEYDRFYEEIRNTQQVWSDVKLDVEISSWAQVSKSIWGLAHDQICMVGDSQFQGQIYWPVRRLLETQWWGF